MKVATEKNGPLVEEDQAVVHHQVVDIVEGLKKSKGRHVDLVVEINTNQSGSYQISSRRVSPDRLRSLRSSRERSHSRDRYRRSRSRKRSRSPSYLKRRSRSVSYSNSRRSHSSSYSRRRSRSPSYSRNRRRSRSFSNKHSRSRSRSWSTREKNSRNRSRSADSYSRCSHSPSRDQYTKKDSNSRSRRSRSTSNEKYRSKEIEKKNSPSFHSVNESEHEKLHHTLKKAIKAAETAGKKLQQQGLLGFDLTPLSAEQQINRENAIEEINAPSFLQRSFSSSNKSKNSDSAPVIVDVAIPTGKTALSTWNHKPESLLHPNISLENKEDRLNRWVKKLFQIRQRSLNGEAWEYA
ncbi:uncharacterized protein LOC142319107 isoform X3 [Lycorma delicatula]|uniref:uncharacterized protein LOC142319107 isoform X3 n=1 Tax=Lycorma delicatula TaxID=130591 RepID=UPI003F517FBF